MRLRTIPMPTNPPPTIGRIVLFHLSRRPTDGTAGPMHAHAAIVAATPSEDGTLREGQVVLYVLLPPRAEGLGSKGQLARALMAMTSSCVGLETLYVLASYSESPAEGCWSWPPRV